MISYERLLLACLVFLTVELLHVDGVLFGQTLYYGGLVILLTTAELLDDAGSFEFSLKLLEGALYVLAFFHGYYNHVVLLLFYFLFRYCL